MITLKAQDLLRALQTARIACGDPASRYTLNCVRIESHGTFAFVVGCDGKQLSVATVDCEETRLNDNESPMELLIKLRAGKADNGKRGVADLIERLVRATGDVNLYRDGTCCWTSRGKRMVYNMALVEGRYPRWRDFIRDTAGDTRWSGDAGAFKRWLPEPDYNWLLSSPGEHPMATRETRYSMIDVHRGTGDECGAFLDVGMLAGWIATLEDSDPVEMFIRDNSTPIICRSGLLTYVLMPCARWNYLRIW